MSIHHASIPTGPRHFKLMRDFYVASLKPLGYGVYWESAGAGAGAVGMQGTAGPDFWLFAGQRDDYELVGRGGAAVSPRDHRAHFAFSAGSREEVDEWYRAAIGAGGIDNGKPGARPEYPPTYYAAFVLDPLGNNIEAVFSKPE